MERDHLDSLVECERVGIHCLYGHVAPGWDHEKSCIRKIEHPTSSTQMNCIVLIILQLGGSAWFEYPISSALSVGYLAQWNSPLPCFSLSKDVVGECQSSPHRSVKRVSPTPGDNWHSTADGVSWSFITLSLPSSSTFSQPFKEKWCELVR